MKGANDLRRIKKTELCNLRHTKFIIRNGRYGIFKWLFQNDNL